MMRNKMIAVIFCITPLLFSSEDRAIKRFRVEGQKENRSAYDKYWNHGPFPSKYNRVYAKGDISEIEKVHEKCKVDYNSDILERENYAPLFQPLAYALICGHTDLAWWLLNEKMVAAAGEDPIFHFIHGIQLREKDEIYTIDAQKYGAILKAMVGRSATINGLFCEQTPLAAYIAPRLFDSYLNPTVIRMLFDNGAQLLTHTDTEKCNVLHHALIYRHTKHTAAASITTLLSEKVKSLQKKYYDTFFKMLLLFNRINATRRSQSQYPLSRNLVYMILDRVEPGDDADICQSLEDRDTQNKTLLEKIQSSEKYENIKNNKALYSILNPLFWKQSFRVCLQKLESIMTEIEKYKNK